MSTPTPNLANLDGPVGLAIRQPVTVIVGVVLLLVAGIVAVTRLPVALTPNVESTIVTVTTMWEGASPEEIETNVVDKQEERLVGLSDLRLMTSTAAQGSGTIRLEFAPGKDKEAALREVSDKLNEVPVYPENVDRPTILASDPDNRDYIAWIVFGTTDDDFDVRILRDFVVDRIEPALERVPGIAEINVLGGREREIQIIVDPVRMAQLGVTPSTLVNALRDTNQNISGGNRDDGKLDVRLRTVGQFDSLDDVGLTVVANGPAGPVRVNDFAEIVATYKEATSFVRSRGRAVMAINAERELGSNVIAVMEELGAAIDRLNAEGGVLDIKSKELQAAGSSEGALTLEQVYDQTVYIHDAINLVQQNIWIGGALAVIVLMLFLRSVRSVGVIAIAIPISVVGAIVAMVALGRSVNVISLAGMAFAVGMVVDNAIVVLENIFRHLEMRKPPLRAAYDGTREVWGAVLASTLTTIIVFIPILLVQGEAGQLFRDLALAICAAVGLSMVVSVTVIPTLAARVLRPPKHAGTLSEVVDEPERNPVARRVPLWFLIPIIGLTVVSAGIAVFCAWEPERLPWEFFFVAALVFANAGLLVYLVVHWRDRARLADGISGAIGHAVAVLCRSWIARTALIAQLAIISIVGTLMLLPPADYLPRGNRNLVMGLIITPPGYSLEHMEALGLRIESVIRPHWEAGQVLGTPAYEDHVAQLEALPTFDYAAQAPGEPVVPPSLENYFLVAFDGILFHGGISDDPARAVDILPLFNHATRAELAPGTIAFPFQVPLFQLGGSSGSAIKVQLAGPDLDAINAAGMPVFMALAERFGFGGVQPSPANFNLTTPEIQVTPDLRRMSRTNLTTLDLGLAVRASGDGAIVDEYRVDGEAIDLTVKIDTSGAGGIADLMDLPLATPGGRIVTLGAIADVRTIGGPPEIARVGRQRALTFQVTPGEGESLDGAIAGIEEVLDGMRKAGILTPGIETTLAGSASKLDEVKTALLGNGTFVGTLGSSLGLALIVVYLLMCVLFQSFLQPLVIMFSVPLATLGGIAALALVSAWSARDRYMPDQTLDVVTMLGFILLIGVVVNNAILIVHQTRNILGRQPELDVSTAIGAAVRTRVRPIFMGMLTSVGGMLPLVLAPGAGSELYRGMGSVVVGGLVISTVFTILLVPLLLSLVLDLERRVTAVAAEAAPEPPRGAAVPNLR